MYPGFRKDGPASSWPGPDGKVPENGFNSILHGSRYDPGVFGHAQFSARGPRPHFQTILIIFWGSKLLEKSPGQADYSKILEESPGQANYSELPINRDATGPNKRQHQPPGPHGLTHRAYRPRGKWTQTKHNFARPGKTDMQNVLLHALGFFCAQGRGCL